jgi:hypothetical protein
MCVRNRFVFSLPIHEFGDWAANSIQVNQAVHFNLLVGNYSREGFNHPGPAFLYILSFGQDVFFALLHVVPARYNGQLIAVFLLNGLLLAFTAVVLYRHARSYLIATAGLATVLWLTSGDAAWSSSWMPFLYQAPFLLATVAGVSVATGSLRDLPFYALAVGLLVHGHIAFIGLMGVFSALVLVTWLALHRGGPGGYRRAVAGCRVPVVTAGVLALLFVLPIAVELALHWPGPWAAYLRYLRSDNPPRNHSFGQAIGYLRHFWPSGWPLALLTIAAGAAGAALVLVNANAPTRRFLAGLLAAVVVMSIETGVYALRGVDFIKETYTGLFYAMIPPLLLVVLILAAGETVLGALVRVAARAAKTRRPPGRVVLAGAAACLVVLLVWQLPLRTASFHTAAPQEADLVPMTSAIARSPLRRDRIVVVDFRQSNWPVVAGLLLQGSRVGLPMCANAPRLSFLFTPGDTCTPAEVERGWQVVVASPNRRYRGQGRSLWSDSRNVIALPAAGEGSDS